MTPPILHGYANGQEPKRTDARTAAIAVDVPRTAGRDGRPSYPQALDRGSRSVGVAMLAVAESKSEEYLRTGPKRRLRDRARPPVPNHPSCPPALPVDDHATKSEFFRAPSPMTCSPTPAPLHRR